MSMLWIGASEHVRRDMRGGGMRGGVCGMRGCGMWYEATYL